MALGCLLPLMWPLEGFRSLEGLEGLEGFRGLGAGKRQAWTPIRSH